MTRFIKRRSDKKLEKEHDRLLGKTISTIFASEKKVINQAREECNECGIEFTDSLKYIIEKAMRRYFSELYERATRRRNLKP